MWTAKPKSSTRWSPRLPMCTGEQRDFSTFFDWGNNSVRGSYEPLPDSILQLTQVEMDKLSAIPGVLDELKNIHSTLRTPLLKLILLTISKRYSKRAGQGCLRRQ